MITPIIHLAISALINNQNIQSEQNRILRERILDNEDYENDSIFGEPELLQCPICREVQEPDEDGELDCMNCNEV